MYECKTPPRTPERTSKRSDSPKSELWMCPKYERNNNKSNRYQALNGDMFNLPPPWILSDEEGQDVDMFSLPHPRRLLTRFDDTIQSQQPLHPLQKKRKLN